METLSVFDWIANLSPWWWVALGVGLGALEMATGSFFLIWPALGAIAMAVLVAFGPTMSGEVTISLYAAVSIILTLIGRSFLNRFGDGGAPETGLNQRAVQIVGRRAKVLSHSGGEGTVEVDGIRWRAVWPHPSSIGGEIVQIDRVDGMTVHVSPITDP